MTAAIPATIAITGAKGTNTALRPLDNAENIVGINLIALNGIVLIESLHFLQKINKTNKIEINN